MEEFRFETPQELENNTQETFHFSPKYEALEELKHIDETSLRTIFEEMRERAGAKGLNGFTPLSKIQLDKEMAGYGELKSGKVTINPVSIAEKTPESLESFRTTLLRVVIHEETHASAKNTDCTGPIKRRVVKAVSDFKDKEEVLQASGLGRTLYKKNIFNLDFHNPEMAPTERVEFNGLNEGVTEKIARHAFDLYLDRTGDRKRYMNKEGKIDSPVVYDRQVAFVDVFIQALSYVCEVSQDAVWNSIMHAYMNGTPLHQPEFETFFNTTFGGAFFEKMRNNQFLSPQEIGICLSEMKINEDQKRDLLRTIESLEQE